MYSPIIVVLGYSELMRLLIYSGFNPRQKDNYWQTPLHLACINGNITAVKELCEQVSACINGHITAVRELCEQVNACINGHITAVRELCEQVSACINSNINWAVEVRDDFYLTSLRKTWSHV